MCNPMELHDKILLDIEKTGFLQELKVGSTLIKNGWSTRHGETYHDRDLQKSREIDIVATKVRHSEKAKFHLEFSLVIDVKKMEKRPWVIFTVNKKWRGLGWRILHNGDNNYSKHDMDFFSGILDSRALEINNFKNLKTRFGIAFHEAFKNPDEGSKAYESLIGVSKAAWHYNESHGPEEIIEFDKKKDVEVYIYIPLVILEGKLFDVNLGEEGEVILSEENFIQVQMNYSSPNYTKRDIEFFPDLITTSHLNEYLQKTEKWMDGMFEYFEESLYTKYRK
jgi:hypothetical protein